MQNLWSQADANQHIAQYDNSDIALCIYASKLLGKNPKLVMHGGGNTSVKTTHKTLFNESVDTVCVKGSGWDLASLEPAGLPALKLQPLVRLRELDTLKDEAMVSYQRAQLLDPHAPNPSIETLLHAFIPLKHIYHTHANAILSVTNQPNGESICKQLFGDTMGIVPYVKPGFDLAKLAADTYDKNPSCTGLILLNHGIFTFADDAKIAYTDMIDAITTVENYIKENKKNTHALTSHKTNYTASEATPIIRQACSLETSHHHYQRMLVSFHSNDLIQSYVNGKNLQRYSQQGVITPDHIIRTKNLPAILPANLDEISEVIKHYTKVYDTYFETHNTGEIQLDSFPRVLLAPGLGLFVTGKTAKELNINADIAQATMSATLDAERIGTFTALPASELFEMEYWSLEQAKLAKQKELPLSRHVVMISGAAGTIGAATAQAFSEQGATLVLLDRDADQCSSIADSIGKSTLPITCDVTDPAQVKFAFEKACLHFGGVDIVISNAGSAHPSKIGEVDDVLLRSSFELNFFAHQTIARHAVKIMRQQKTGGKLLFNVSKQALNPGLDFGPYGIPKAALLALVRQYALDYAADGIQANAVNADRIRSGLLNKNMIEQRAKARGLSEEDYMRGNLLKREVTADDVAQAFVHLALAHKTTAGITTVDGGNMAAAVR